MYKKIKRVRAGATIKVAIELRDLIKVHAAELRMSMRILVDEIVANYFDNIGLLDSSYSLKEEGKDDDAQSK